MAKSKVSKECIDAAAEALSHFTDSELSQYVTEVFNKAKEYKDVAGELALDRAQEEINNEVLANLNNDARTLAEDAAKHEVNTKPIEEKKQTLRDLLIKRYEGLGRTVSGFKKSAIERLRNVMEGQLDAAHQDYMKMQRNDAAIFQALDGKTTTEQAKKIASAVNEYMDHKNAELVNSGAMRFEQLADDRYLGANHNASKILSGKRSIADAAKSLLGYNADANKPLWREFIKSKLNLYETFKKTDAIDLDGNVIHAKVDEILDDIFDNITQGVNDIFTKSRVVKGEREILKKRRMFFKFKDWESWGHYNAEYGTGDFHSALIADIQGSGSRIGTSQILGSDPYRAYYDLKKVQQKASPATSDIRSKGAAWYQQTDNYFKNAMGGAPTENPALSNFMGNLRTLSSFAKLPMIQIASLPDIAYVSSYGARWGMNYWKNFGYLMKNAFGLVPNAERAHIGKLFKSLCDSDLGYISRVSESQNSSEMLKSASMWWFRKIGLHAYDTSNKVGMMHLMARHLGELSERTYNGLNDSLKKQLIKHGISEDEWNIIRQNTKQKLFTTDNVMNATDSQLRELWNKTDKMLPLSQMRNTLYNKVYSIFDVASENAVLAPGEFEKAFLYRGTAPGTVPGELMRSFGFFKAYPLAYIDRVLVNGFKDATGSRAKFGWALQMALGSMPLSVLSNYMTYYAKGLDFPDITQMSPSELVKFGGEMILGNLGVFLNLADARNQNKSLIVSQFKTAPLELLGDMISTPLALATGNWKEAGKDFTDAAEHVLPLRTLPVIGAYWDAALKHKPYLQPHQHAIYGHKGL